MANVRVGNRVELTDKNIVGRVAYVGMTKFAKGRWVGIVLDEKKGKNNGTVEGYSYFNCADNHGIFVKAENLFIRVLDDTFAVPNTPKTSSSLTSSLTGSLSGISSIKPPSNFGSERNLHLASGGTASPAGTQLPQPIPTTIVKPIGRPSISMEPSRTSISRQNSSLQKATSHVETLSQTTNVSAIGGGSISAGTRASLSGSSAIGSNDEFENLRAEVKDLNEKIEILKAKRAEDRLKLMEFEKTKIHLEQLQEFKRQITESHSELNKQLLQAKKEAKEAIEEKNKHAEEMKDLADTAEIATLDKEMAEEKYEILSREYEQTKERLDEVQVEYELLKSEIESSGSTEVASNYQVLHLEQQNEKLREAIFKLRDLSAQDKSEIHKLNKELQSVIDEKASLENLRDKHSKDLLDYEEQVRELREQIDFTLGAQEMVEKLTDRNLQLEDQISKMKEEMEDLENLHDVNDQLVETMRDTELQLREELDTMTVKLHELTKRLEEGQEAMAEYECTIQKLRDIVTRLKRENDQLKMQSTSDTQNREEEKQKMVQAESLQFKMRFAEAKVFCRAIEMDLRRLEVAQANEYIKYLSLFMPDSFFIRGGDNDAIQVLLFIPRIISKLHIISRQINEKYPVNFDMEDQVNSTFMFRENEPIQQQLFVRKLLYLISSMDTLLAQYQDALRSCPLELYLKIASLFPELNVHEKTIDNYIELLKKDQLDENIPLEQLEKSLLYFINVYTMHLADGKIHDCFKLLNSFTGLMKHAMDATSFDTLVIRSCVRNECDNEKFEHFSSLLTTFSEVRALVKKIKRRLAGETKIKLTSSIENDVRDSIFKVNKVASILSTLRKTSLELCDKVRAQNSNELELPLVAYTEIEQSVNSLGGFELVKQHLSSIVSICSQLTSGLQQGDYEEDIKVDEQPHSISSLSSLEAKNPLETRAEYLKAQSGQLNELKIKLETKQADLNEMKKLLRTKNEEWQEMKIRKERVENKLQKSTQEADERVAKLQNELDDLGNTLKRREKENEETMNHLQADIEALESERANLREKLKTLSKKSNAVSVDSLAVKLPLSPSTPTASGVNTGLASFGGTNLQSSIAATAANLSALEASYLEQIRILKLALRRTNDHLLNLKAKIYAESLKPLPKIGKHKPLWLLRAQGKLEQSQLTTKMTGSKSGGETSPEESEEEEEDSLANNYYVQLNELLRRITQLEKEATFAIIEESRIRPNVSLAMQLQEDKLRNQILNSKYSQLTKDVEQFILQHFDNQEPGFQDMLQLLSRNTEKFGCKFLAARVTLPTDDSNQSINVSIDVTLQQLKNIHAQLF